MFRFLVIICTMIAVKQSNNILRGLDFEVLSQLCYKVDLQDIFVAYKF